MKSVATMEKIAEDEEDVFNEGTKFESGKKKILFDLDHDPLQARKERRERRMSERRLSRNMTTTYLQPVRQGAVH